jgi:hypothetical protein
MILLHHPRQQLPPDQSIHNPTGVMLEIKKTSSYQRYGYTSKGDLLRSEHGY